MNAVAYRPSRRPTATGLSERPINIYVIFGHEDVYMPRLYENESETLLGEITDSQLQALIEHMEGASIEDGCFVVHDALVAALYDAPIDESIREMLWVGLADSDSFVLGWETD